MKTTSKTSPKSTKLAKKSSQTVEPGRRSATKMKAKTAIKAGGTLGDGRSYVTGRS